MLSKDPFIPPPPPPSPPRCKETSISQKDAWLTCSPEPLLQREKEKGGDAQAQYFIPEAVSEPAHSFTEYCFSGKRSVLLGAALCHLIPHPPAFLCPEAESCCRAAGTETLGTCLSPELPGSQSAGLESAAPSRPGRCVQRDSWV